MNSVLGILQQPTVYDNLLLIVIGYLVICCLFGLSCSSITTHKSGGPGAGFILGFLLLVLGWMFCLLIPYKPIELIQNRKERRQPFKDSHRQATQRCVTKGIQGKERDELIEKLDERIK